MTFSLPLTVQNSERSLFSISLTLNNLCHQSFILLYCSDDLTRYPQRATLRTLFLLKLASDILLKQPTLLSYPLHQWLRLLITPQEALSATNPQCLQSGLAILLCSQGSTKTLRHHSASCLVGGRQIESKPQCNVIGL